MDARLEFADHLFHTEIAAYSPGAHFSLSALHDRLKDLRPWFVPDSVYKFIARKLVGALRHLQNRRVVHRDLKDVNILIK